VDTTSQAIFGNIGIAEQQTAIKGVARKDMLIKLGEGLAKVLEIWPKLSHVISQHLPKQAKSIIFLQIFAQSMSRGLTKDPP